MRFFTIAAAAASVLALTTELRLRKVRGRTRARQRRRSLGGSALDRWDPRAGATLAARAAVGRGRCCEGHEPRAAACHSLTRRASRRHSRLKAAAARRQLADTNSAPLAPRFITPTARSTPTRGEQVAVWRAGGARPCVAGAATRGFAWAGRVALRGPDPFSRRSVPTAPPPPAPPALAGTTASPGVLAWAAAVERRRAVAGGSLAVTCGQLPRDATPAVLPRPPLGAPRVPRVGEPLDDTGLPSLAPARPRAGDPSTGCNTGEQVCGPRFARQRVRQRWRDGDGAAGANNRQLIRALRTVHRRRTSP